MFAATNYILSAVHRVIAVFEKPKSIYITATGYITTLLASSSIVD